MGGCGRMWKSRTGHWSQPTWEWGGGGVRGPTEKVCVSRLGPNFGSPHGGRLPVRPDTNPPPLWTPQPILVSTWLELATRKFL